MKKLYIIGNWKSFKRTNEAKDWLETIASLPMHLQSDEKEKIVILAPSATLLSTVSTTLAQLKLPFILGAQDASPFGMGAYTGADNAEQLKEFVTYALIGHSERRRYFNETEEMLAKKVEQVRTQGITPIYCIQKKEAVIPSGVTIVGYEPVSAIGTGNPDTPEMAEEVAKYVKTTYPFVEAVLYGGSVTPKNVGMFTSVPDISGVIIGGASLDPQKFSQLINNA